MTFSIRQCVPCIYTPEPTNHNNNQPKSTPNPPEAGSSMQMESVSSEQRKSPRTGTARQKELLAQVQTPPRLISNAKNLAKQPRRYSEYLARQEELRDDKRDYENTQHWFGSDAEKESKFQEREFGLRRLLDDILNEAFSERLDARLEEMELKNGSDTQSDIASDTLEDIKHEIIVGMTNEGWAPPRWKHRPDWKPQSGPSQ